MAGTLQDQHDTPQANGGYRADPPALVFLVGSPGLPPEILESLSGIGFEVQLAGVGGRSLCAASDPLVDLVAIEFFDQELAKLQWVRSYRSESPLGRVPLVAILPPDRPDLRLQLSSLCVDECFDGPQLSQESCRRLRSLANRAPSRAHQSNQLRYADLVLDPLQLKVWRNGKRIHLTSLHFSVLRALMIRPGEILSKHELRALVWRDRTVNDKAIVKCMERLRRCLNAAGGEAFIRSARGSGYLIATGR